MAGRILNRSARNKMRDGLIEATQTVGKYVGLKIIYELAKISLDAGPDVEAVRLACNERREYLLQFKRKVEFFENELR